MKKRTKIFVIIVLIITVFLGVTFCFVDKNRISKGERPIFCYDASGGSVILYYGLGYTIFGAADGGGLKNAKIGFLGIYE